MVMSEYKQLGTAWAKPRFGELFLESCSLMRYQQDGNDTDDDRLASQQGLPISVIELTESSKHTKNFLLMGNLLTTVQQQRRQEIERNDAKLTFILSFQSATPFAS